MKEGEAIQILEGLEDKLIDKLVDSICFLFEII